MREKKEYNPDDYIRVAYGVIGHNSRASDFIYTEEQGMDLDLALQDLKEVISKMYPKWVTINIEVKETKK